MILADNSYIKYLKFRRAQQVQVDPNLFYCTTPNCEEVLHVNEAVKNLVTCNSCKKKTCSKCKMPNHGKTSCEKNPENQLKKWAGSVKIHSCPNCNTKIEKNEGCPHMNCLVCNYSWCWTCGFHRNHWLHKVAFGGVFCELFNAFSLGFALEKLGKFNHWTLRFLLTLLGVCLAPIIFIVITWFIFYKEIWRYGRKSKKLFFCIPCPKEFCLYKLLWLVLMTLQVLILFILYTVAMVIVLALMIAPFYLFLVIYLFILMFRFCCQPKFVKSTEQQSKLV